MMETILKTENARSAVHVMMQSALADWTHRVNCKNWSVAGIFLPEDCGTPRIYLTGCVAGLFLLASIMFLAT